MQRLPSQRIQRAQEVSEIGFEEHPAAAGLGSRNEPALGPGADFLGMHAQKRSRLVEIERSFSEYLRAGHERWASTAHGPGPGLVDGHDEFGSCVVPAV